MRKRNITNSSMGNDQLQRWALIAEIVGGLAVIFSLIFVGMEIRQSSDETALNTRAIETSSFYALSSALADLNEVRVIYPHVEELHQRARENDPTLTESERGQFRAYLQMVVTHTQLAHMQYENEIISEASLRSMLTAFSSIFSESEISISLWNGARHTRIPSYVSYMEILMKERSRECVNDNRDVCDYWLGLDPI